MYLICLRLNITFTSTLPLPQLLLVPTLTSSRASCAPCALLDLDFNCSTPPCLDLTQTPVHLALIAADRLRTLIRHTLHLSDSPQTLFHPTSNSCQSQVQPTCNRQVVNLPARLDTLFLPSQHVRTPTRVPFVTLTHTISSCKTTANASSSVLTKPAHSHRMS